MKNDLTHNQINNQVDFTVSLKLNLNRLFKKGKLKIKGLHKLIKGGIKR
jgi:hypothetical protein